MNENKWISIRKALLILVLLTSLMGCKKFLDVKPDYTLTIPENLSDLQAILDASKDMNIQQTPSFGTASGDYYFLTDDVFNSFPIEFKTIYTWNRVDYRGTNDWSHAYLAVYNANFCLDQLRKITRTTDNGAQWDNVKGSALFFRSYNFLNLLWVYAKAWDASTASQDLGIALRMGSDFNVPSVRATVKESYERVLLDAKEALALLPDFPLHVMRPSKVAAMGLLARAYLSMRQYDSAYKYADQCLQFKNDLMDFNSDPDISGTINATVPFKKFNKENIFYTEMNTNFAIHGPYYAMVDTLLYEQYAENDLRKAAYFLPSGTYYKFKGSYTGTSYQFFSGLATDEMFLTRAECQARKNRVPEALSDLNHLLKTRWNSSVPYSDLTASTAEEALEIILTERRKELFMRGLRWMDIKRLNKEGRNIILKRIANGQTYTLEPNSSYYALPLPVDIIEQSGMPQN